MLRERFTCISLYALAKGNEPLHLLLQWDIQIIHYYYDE